jgi:hypothetical protein
LRQICTPLCVYTPFCGVHNPYLRFWMPCIISDRSQAFCSSWTGKIKSRIRHDMSLLLTCWFYAVTIQHTPVLENSIPSMSQVQSTMHALHIPRPVLSCLSDVYLCTPFFPLLPPQPTYLLHSIYLTVDVHLTHAYPFLFLRLGTRYCPGTSLPCFPHTLRRLPIVRKWVQTLSIWIDGRDTAGFMGICE